MVQEIEVTVEEQEHEQEMAEAGKEKPTIDQYIEHLQRLKAEFDNYRKRVAQEREQQADQMKGEFCRKLLPILDDLERALEHSDQDCQGMSTGIHLVYRNLWLLLEAEGLTRISTLGQQFDPYVHEAVMVETNHGDSGERVTEEIQRGYLYKGKLLRPAKVKVSKGAEKESSKSDGSQGLL